MIPANRTSGRVGAAREHSRSEARGRRREAGSCSASRLRAFRTAPLRGGLTLSRLEARHGDGDAFARTTNRRLATFTRSLTLSSPIRARSVVAYAAVATASAPSATRP
jgi:hypothetical protein